jgi:hypothetical protein
MIQHFTNVPRKAFYGFLFEFLFCLFHRYPLPWDYINSTTFAIILHVKRSYTPVLDRTLAAWFEESEANFDDKFDNYGRYMKNLSVEAAVAAAEKDALKAEMDRLSRRVKAAEAKQDSLRALLMFTFERMGITKHKTWLFTAYTQNTVKSAKPAPLFAPDKAPDLILNRELSSGMIKEALASGRLHEKEGDLERGKLFFIEGY